MPWSKPNMYNTLAQNYNLEMSDKSVVEMSDNTTNKLNRSGLGNKQSIDSKASTIRQ